jgi:hypothetical protein
LRVRDVRFDRLAEDASLRVDLVERHLHDVSERHLVTRHGSAQRVQDARADGTDGKPIGTSSKWVFAAGAGTCTTARVGLSDLRCAQAKMKDDNAEMASNERYEETTHVAISPAFERRQR